MKGEEPLTSELIREVGQLSDVRMFDYALWGYNFLKPSLIPVTSFEETEFDVGGIPGAFTLRGIQYHHVMDIELGLIEFREGRVFTEDEIKTGASVTMVNQAFLTENALTIGDTITLMYRIYNEEAM